MLEESEWQEARCPEKDKHKKRKNKHSRDKKTKNTLEDVKTQISPSDALKSNLSDHSLSSDVPVKDDKQLPDEVVKNFGVLAGLLTESVLRASLRPGLPLAEN